MLTLSNQTDLCRSHCATLSGSLALSELSFLICIIGTMVVRISKTLCADSVIQVGRCSAGLAQGKGWMQG